MRRINLLVSVLSVFFISAYMVHAAPITTSQPTILPQADSQFDIGTSTKAWRDGFFDRLCLTGDVCITTWPGGGSGSAAWGDITGTLANQTDLQSALDLKISVGTTSVGSITTLPNLSLPYSQLTGIPATFSYPFPSNATTTKLTFSGGLSTTYASTTAVSGTALCIGSDCRTTWPSGGGTTWGDITGTLSDQTDLQAALDAKLSLSAWYATTTTALAEGSNLYFTTARATANFVSNLAGTTSVASIITLPSLSLPYSQLTGTPTIPTKVSDLTNDSAFISSVVANYPLQGSGTSASHLSLAFGTTTANIWGALNTFGNASSTQFTATDAWITKLRNLTSNGFVKTSGGDGTLSVDTNTYLTGNQTITLSGDVSGSGATSITTTIGNGKVTNAMLANSTISGVALGSSLNALSNDATLSGTSYDGSGAVSDWGIDLAHANSWTGLQTFANATTTLLSANYASSTQAFFGNLSIGGLTGVLKGSSGVVSAAANGTDYTLITANSCSAGQHVSGVTAAGVVSCSADSASPAGSFTQVQYNNGSAFGADASFFISTTSNATTLSLGTGSVSGIVGGVLRLGNVGTGTNGFYTIQTANTGAASQTFTLPNKTGTFALGTGSQSDLAYWAGTNTITNVATTTRTYSAGFSNTGTLGAQVGGANAVVSQIEHPSFTYATSTAWTGTTTIPLQVGYGQVINTATCFTDAGTLNVDLYHSTSHLNMFNASTTAGTISFTSNNTITSGDKVYVDLGTPASSPTKITCTIKDTI